MKCICCGQIVPKENEERYIEALHVLAEEDQNRFEIFYRLSQEDKLNEEIEKRNEEYKKERERELADIEAQRMETYEGGPLPDANYYDHDY